MILYVCDRNPVLAAQALDDLRLNSAVLEVAQLLSSVMANLGLWNGTMYEPSDNGGPFSMWGCASKNNFRWLYHYGIALCEEFEYRWPKVKPKARQVMEICWATFTAQEMRPIRKEMTPFRNITQWDLDDPVEAYRRLLCEYKWTGMSPVWTNRNKPSWFYQKGKLL